MEINKNKSNSKKAITNIPVNKTNKSMITILHQRKIETQTNYLSKCLTRELFKQMSK